MRRWLIDAAFELAPAAFVGTALLLLAWGAIAVIGTGVLKDQ